MKKGHFNRSVDIRYSIVAFNMSLLTAKLQLGLPCRNVWINLSLPWDKTCSLIFLILLRRLFLGVWKLGQWRKKCVAVSVSLPQPHNGFRVSWKLGLNLWSWRLLRPSRNLVRSLIPCGLWILKMRFAQGRIKFRKFFLKTERLPEFPGLQSILFYSI